MAIPTTATYLGNFTPAAESFASVARSVSSLITPPNLNVPYFRVRISCLANGMTTASARFGMKVILTPNSSSTLSVAQVWNGNNTTYTFDGLNTRGGFPEWISPTINGTINTGQVFEEVMEYVVPNFCGSAFYVITCLTYESAGAGSINHRVEVSPCYSL